MITSKFISKDLFFSKFGSSLVTFCKDDPETGDHLLYHPEEEHIARAYAEQGHQVVSIQFTDADHVDELVNLNDPFEEHPEKYGYFVLETI